MNPTYYQVLGVPRTATQAEIKAAFKALAIRFHPDKHGGSTVYESRFKQVNEAYQVLSDARKKQLYDLKLSYSQPRPTNFGATSPYQASTIFRQPGTGTFNPGPGYRPNTQPPPPPRPAQAQARPAPKKDPRKLTPRDYGIFALILACLVGFGLVVKFTMDHITAVDNYENALARIEDQRYSEAHLLLQQAVQFKPEFGEAYLKMADLELQVYNMPVSAQQNYTRAFKHLASISAESYYNRAKTYMQTGQFTQAHNDLSKALETDTTLARASLDRGIIRLHHLGQAKAAIADFSRFIRQTTDSSLAAQAYQFRGYAHHQTGKLEASEADYRRSISFDAKNSVTYSLLGELKLAQEDASAACSYFAIAYNLGDLTQESNLRRYCGRVESAF